MFNPLLLSNCDNTVLINAIDCRLSQLAVGAYNNMVFMLNKCVKYQDFFDLLTYRRILQYLEVDSSYITACAYSEDDVYWKVRRLTQGCISECPTTTTTTAIPSCFMDGEAEEQACTTTTSTTTEALIKRIMMSCAGENNGRDCDYAKIEQGWYIENFPYEFTLESLIINGIEYANNEVLTINTQNELQVGMGINNLYCVTNITDWLNAIIPNNSGLVVYNELCIIDFPEGSTFSISLSETNLEPLNRKFYYDQTGVKMLFNALPEDVDYFRYYVDFYEEDCSEKQIIRYSMGERGGQVNPNYAYHKMEKGWFPEEFPYTFTIVSFTTSFGELASNETLTISSPSELQTGIGFDNNVYITNIVDWINSFIPSEIGLKFYDDMKVMDKGIYVDFNIHIIGSYGVHYYYDTNGFSIFFPDDYHGLYKEVYEI